MKQSRITNILSYFLRRVILCIPVIFGVIIITFFITRAVPGDPVLRLLPEKFTAEMYEREKARIGLDKPLIIQFIVYMIDVLRGNWGYSIGVFPRSEVWNMIFQWLPRSLEIMFLSMFIAAFIGIKLGKFSASHRNKPSDYTIRSFSYVGMSVPMFVIGYFLIIFCLATGIKIFPFYGYKSPGIGNPPTLTHSRIIDCIISGNFYMLFDYGLHLFLPMIGITIGQLVLISRQTRGSLISILQTDYIRTARAKGLPAKIILKRHALRNAFIPTISSKAHINEIIAASLIKSIASSLDKLLSPSLCTNTRRGVEIARFILHPTPLLKRIALKSFMPPAVDPAAPPIIIANESKSLAELLHKLILSTEENPVQVNAEIN